jgi:hypothetical protein
MKKNDPSGFEVFEARKKAKHLDGDQVSLSKSNILLSEELSKQLAGTSHVVLLYNRHAHVIGIRPAGPEENGYKISYRSISSRSFCQHFRIEERGRFKVRIDASGMLIVALRNADDEPA